LGFGPRFSDNSRPFNNISSPETKSTLPTGPHPIPPGAHRIEGNTGKCDEDRGLGHHHGPEPALSKVAGPSLAGIDPDRIELFLFRRNRLDR